MEIVIAICPYLEFNVREILRAHNDPTLRVQALFELLADVCPDNAILAGLSPARITNRDHSEMLALLNVLFDLAYD
jgi:hypothetical protein